MNKSKIKLNPEDEFIISDSKILLYDPNAMSRSLISTSLSEIGFKQIEKIGEYEFAIKSLEENIFDAVVTSVDIYNHDEFKLIKFIRSNEDYNNISLVMIAEEINDSLVAKWTALGVDLYLSKPFTPVTLGRTLIDGLKAKFSPSEFDEKCNIALNFMKEGKLNEALDILKLAVQEAEHPTNGYYLLGQISIRRSNLEEAMIFFREALKRNPLHLKSLLGFAFCAKSLGQEDILYNTYFSILYLDPLNSNAFTYIVKEGMRRNEFGKIYEILYQYKFITKLPETVTAFIHKNCELLIKKMLMKEMYDQVRLIYVLIKKVISDDVETYLSVINILSKYKMSDLVSDSLMDIEDRIKDKNVITIIKIRELFNTKNYEQAIIDCHRNINSGKPEDDIYMILIDSYIELGNLKKAWTTYEEALKFADKPSIIVDKYTGVFGR